MKNNLFGSLAIMLLVIINFGCQKDKIPVLSTNGVTAITAISAISGGTINDEGSGTIISRGVCWSTNITPTEADNKTQDGAGAGTFSSNISGLIGGTTYYVRAYATNNTGTGYGMAMSFTTLGQSPLPTITAATNLNALSATLKGSVNANYLPTVVIFEYGITTDYGSSITAIQSPLTGNTVTLVSANITELTPVTNYHYRIKATNSLGTTYSNDITFTTLGKVPTVTTLAATNTTTVAAQLNCTVNANYLPTVVTFEYGTTTSYGSVATATQSPVTGNSNTSLSANIIGLTVATTYHYRIKAVNSLGTTFGNDITFKTLGQVPSVTIISASSTTTIATQLNGTVNANYLSTVVTFEYGMTSSYGNTAIATQSPITGNTNTYVSVPITNLTSGTTFHYRIVATNSLGTTNSNDITFTTLGQVPTVIVLAASSTTPIAAQLNGTVNANYLSTVVTFEYGMTSSYGSIAPAAQSPLTGNTITNVNALITGLTTATTYHFRIVAVNSLGTTYGNDMTFTAVYAIGGNVNGGIIFYVDGTGQHGLVCALTNQATTAMGKGAEWGCNGTLITGADGTSISTGNQNTIDIVNGCATTGIAAKICDDLILSGYTDWFLPSKDELSLMYTNLKANGFGNLDVNYYWSSSETNSGTAWAQSFFSGLQISTSKYFLNDVRAIRAF